MRIPRIFLDQTLTEGFQVTLDPRAHHHVVQVLRLRANTNLCLFNGDGNNYFAAITSIDRRLTTARIDTVQPGLPESPLQLVLGTAIAKGERMDFIMQKAVELGVTSIRPILANRGSQSPSTERLLRRRQHWQGVVISACEQCGRSRIPALAEPLTLAEWLRTETYRVALALDPQGTRKITQIEPPENPVAVLIGPEGGWNEDELADMTRYDVLQLRLGPRILRTETAALCAITLVQAAWGDLTQ